MWGSDIVAEALSRCGFAFAAINPGASYRGLHDSFVNHPPGKLELVTCLHEEHAVALAHGWTKVTDRPALAIVHSNVGTLHAAMAVYNAWADRAPVFVLSATGAMDAEKRRPWIEWIHTVQDQGQILRAFTKWDDQPGSAEAAARSIAQGRLLAAQAPCGPVHVCLDVTIQETECPAPVDVEKLISVHEATAAGLTEAQAEDIARRIADADRPLFVFGRLPRDHDDWTSRIDLVTASGALAFTDIRSAAAFPTDHPAHVGAPGFAPDPAQRAALAECDLLTLFDAISPGSLVDLAPKAQVITISPELAAHRGWVKDAHALPSRGTLYPVSPSGVARAIAARLPAPSGSLRAAWAPDSTTGAGETVPAQSLAAPPAFARIARGLARLRSSGTELSISRLPLSWDGGLLPFRHPLDYLGRDGGEGLASGPGIAVGVAMALQGTGRLPVAVLGDGDFMMGSSALWTAANRRLPLLCIVAANGVYGNDVVHQERVARLRGRDVDNRWIGQELNQPEIRIADLCHCIGAVAAARIDQFDDGLEDAVVRLGQAALKQDGPAVLEVVMPAERD